MVLFWPYDSVDVIIRSSLAGPLLLGTLPASFYNWNLIKGNKDFVGLGKLH